MLFCNFIYFSDFFGGGGCFFVNLFDFGLLEFLISGGSRFGLLPQSGILSNLLGVDKLGYYIT